MSIYLDNNATTLIDPEVVECMNTVHRSRLANPSSQHGAGRAARRVIETARDSILAHCGARTVGMQSDGLILTSGGTEANNLALFGLTHNRPGPIIVSTIEHPSILGAADYCAQHGREVRYLPCDRSGVIDLSPLESWLKNTSSAPIALVSLMLANNETGVLQRIEQAARLCRRYSTPIHTDAVQVLGKSPMSFEQLDVDAMTITAHKLHGPVGIGGLILRHGVALSPMLFGGFQQLGLRPGTESPVLAAGFARAIALATGSMDVQSQRMQRLRQRLESGILERLSMSVVLGTDAQRLPHTLSVSFPGLDRQAVQLALDRSGVACSTGSACASGSSQPSHVLQAMGLEPELVRGGIRLSLSRETTESDIDQALEIIPREVGRLWGLVRCPDSK